MMKAKFWIWALVMILVALAPSFAWAEARFPTERGAVTDDADVLSESMRKDMGEFATLAQARASVSVRVATVHFLDGLGVQDYANQLFRRWELGENGFLLLAAAGEDSFAAASGAGFKKTVSDSNVQLLLSTSGFGSLLKEQQYDDAFGRFFVAFRQSLGKQFSVDMDSQRLFAAYQEGVEPAYRPTATPRVDSAPQAAQVPRSSLTDVWNNVTSRFDSRAYESNARQKARESEGMSFGGMVVLGILIWLVFGGSKAAKGGRRILGCGCGPLGWIFSLLGVSRLLGRRR